MQEDIGIRPCPWSQHSGSQLLIRESAVVYNPMLKHFTWETLYRLEVLSVCIYYQYTSINTLLNFTLKARYAHLSIHRQLYLPKEYDN